jgi:hypothetical protein
VGPGGKHPEIEAARPRAQGVVAAIVRPLHGDVDLGAVHLRRVDDAPALPGIDRGEQRERVVFGGQRIREERESLHVRQERILPGGRRTRDADRGEQRPSEHAADRARDPSTDVHKTSPCFASRPAGRSGRPCSL